MSEIDRLVLQDDDGNEYTIFVESKDAIALPDAPTGSEEDDEYESMGISEAMKAKLKDVHSTIQAYAWYAMGAFKHMAFAEVEEMTLKFGLKIAGKAGLPVLTEGSAEGNFQIEVKCKFKE